MAYFVRVTASYDEIKPFCETVPAETLVVYEHDASQVHCHFYIKTTLATDSLKVRLKKLRTFDKTQWSFKTAKDDLCVRYMAKGKYDPKYVRGYDIEQINKFKADWRPNLPKEKTTTIYDMAEAIFNNIQIETITSEEALYREAIRQAIIIHHKQRKAFCEFSLSKVVETAVAFTPTGQQALERRLMLKFNRDR